MERDFKLSFRHVWLAMGVCSLILPVFLPSVAAAEDPVQNIILVANILMFALALPCSLFAVPIIVAANYYLDMPPDSIQGMYLNTVLFFVIGFLQWFYLARFWSPTEPPLQMLDLFAGEPKLRLGETGALKNIPFNDAEGRTPVERVFQEKDFE